MNSRQDRERKKVVADAFQEASAYLYKIYEPQWIARNDALKTLASVSSGALILSVTFSSSITSLKVGARWRYVILFTFLMFGLALFSALISIWIGVGLHHLQSAFVDNRKAIQALVDKIDPSSEDMREPFQPLLDKTNKPFQTKDEWAERLFNISFVSFGLAALSLVAIAIKQFLA
ncbi:MAG: hypothetical protein M3R69_10905 [Acidobacteriota bacterium]|nr:hypothetical protein [Acidobacteriota bacterium]